MRKLEKKCASLDQENEDTYLHHFRTDFDPHQGDLQWDLQTSEKLESCSELFVMGRMQPREFCHHF